MQLHWISGDSVVIYAKSREKHIEDFNIKQAIYLLVEWWTDSQNSISAFQISLGYQYS